MSGTLWLPQAIRKDKGQRLTFTTTTRPKGILHTTQTAGRASYRGWTENPHGEVFPIPGKGVEVQQFVPLSHASFSLKNLPGGVQTNRAFAFQWELVGRCTKDGPGYYWPAADDAVLLDLYRKVIHPLSAALGIPLVWEGGPRLSGAAWTAYTGWGGHRIVPENDHVDPGDFPWARMLQVAAAHSLLPDLAAALARPRKASGGIPGLTGYVLARGAHGGPVGVLQRLLNQRGARLVVDYQFGAATERAVRTFQTAHHLVADGVAGRSTIHALGG